HPDSYRLRPTACQLGYNANGFISIVEPATTPGFHSTSETTTSAVTGPNDRGCILWPLATMRFGCCFIGEMTGRALGVIGRGPVRRSDGELSPVPFLTPPAWWD